MRLRVKQANLTRILNLMSSCGLIERATHGKQAIFELTSSGIEAVPPADTSTDKSATVRNTPTWPGLEVVACQLLTRRHLKDFTESISKIDALLNQMKIERFRKRWKIEFPSGRLVGYRKMDLRWRARLLIFLRSGRSKSKTCHPTSQNQYSRPRRILAW